jgi:hypothetical protein
VNQFQSTTKITTTNYQLVVAEDLSLNGRLNVTQDASLNGNVYVKGSASIGGSLGVADQIQFNYSTLPTLSTTSLGYTITAPLSIGTTTYSGTTTFDITLTTGTWFISTFIRCATFQSGGSYVEISNQTTSTSLGIAGSSTNTLSQTWMGTLCTTTTISANNIFRLYLTLAVASQLLTGSSYKATRIA